MFAGGRRSRHLSEQSQLLRCGRTVLITILRPLRFLTSEKPERASHFADKKYLFVIRKFFLLGHASDQIGKLFKSNFALIP